MGKPLIGIVPLVDERRDSYWMLPGYMKGIEEAGGIPLMLPLTGDRQTLASLANKLDGLLFSGGHDVNPALYGELPSEHCGEICRERDEMEELLFRLGLERKKPMLGICRGIQLMNVLLGGTLYQHIPEESPSELTHKQAPPYHKPVHSVQVVQGTPLHDMVKCDAIEVNSYHHQAIKELGSGLAVMATAEDGLIEAVYMPEEPFVLAVQWHPEFAYETDECSKELFKAFVLACSK